MRTGTEHIHELGGVFLQLCHFYHFQSQLIIPTDRDPIGVPPNARWTNTLGWLARDLSDTLRAIEPRIYRST